MRVDKIRMDAYHDCMENAPNRDNLFHHVILEIESPLITMELEYNDCMENAPNRDNLFYRVTFEVE